MDNITTAAQKAWTWLTDHLVDVEDFSPPEEKTPRVEPLPCKTFDELCGRFEESNYLLTQASRDCLAAVLATNLSNEYKSGDPIWFYLIGPSGSGKTTLIKAIAGLPDRTFFVSKFTGLHSGLAGSGENDPTLVRYIQDKTLTVKDWTVVLTLPPGTKDTVYSEMRDFFDGESTAHYRNRVHRSFKDVRFTCIACSTEAVRKDNYTSLGERFLQIEIIDDTHSRNKQIAMSTTALSDAMTAEDAVKHGRTTEEIPNADVFRQQYTAGFIQTCLDRINRYGLPFFPEKYKRKIDASADLVSFVRSKVEREGYDKETSYRPRAEIGGRVAQQLHKLAYLLAIVLDKKAVDDEVYRICRKVARDTANGYTFEIAEILYQNQENGLTRTELASKLRLSPTTVHRRLRDMMELGIAWFEKVPNETGNRGRNKEMYRLTKRLYYLGKRADVFDEQPDN